MASPPRFASDADVRSLAATSLLRLFDSLYEGAVAVDRDGRITWINDKYKALIGWNGIEPIEGRAIEEVIPNSRLREVARSGQPELLDIFSIGERQVVVSRIPLHDEGGHLIGALGVILYDRLQALRPIVSKFQGLQADLAKARRLLAEGRQARYRLENFVGGSAVSRQVRERALRAAEREGTVLLLGETGTGKELLAHAIHAASRRGDGPLVGINAAAIPDGLLEAELFGVEPGAYTGAGNKSRPGKFQLADGGTLFLDEVGDMPAAVQSKLLRVLQEGEVEPLGGSRVRRIDVRVIAATSRDLKAMVDAGGFRADLYYRLNVLPLALPPLRERVGDLPELCAALLAQMAERTGEPMRRLTPAAVDRLSAHAWPGNVRELQNVLEQAVARHDGEELDAAAFDMLPGTAASHHARQRKVVPLREAVALAERNAILDALAEAGGVRAQAARRLGISRAQFYEKLAIHGLMSGEPDIV